MGTGSAVTGKEGWGPGGAVRGQGAEVEERAPVGGRGGGCLNGRFLAMGAWWGGLRGEGRWGAGLMSPRGAVWERGGGAGLGRRSGRSGHPSVGGPRGGLLAVRGTVGGAALVGAGFRGPDGGACVRRGKGGLRAAGGDGGVGSLAGRRGQGYVPIAGGAEERALGCGCGSVGGEGPAGLGWRREG